VDNVKIICLITLISQQDKARKKNSFVRSNDFFLVWVKGVLARPRRAVDQFGSWIEWDVNSERDINYL